MYNSKVNINNFKDFIQFIYTTSCGLMSKYVNILQLIYATY